MNNSIIPSYISG